MRAPSPHLTEAVLRATSYHGTDAQPPRATAMTIAVSREAGALGSTVGQELAVRLGWHLYDQELLQRVGAEMGLRPSVLESVDERPIDWVREFLVGIKSGPMASQPTYVHHLLEVLARLALQGECIIVGRGAPHLLPPESTLRVRLVAPRAFRVGVIQKSKQLTAEAAARWIDATDRERSAFVKSHFDRDPADPSQYDLVVNVERFSVPQAAGLVIGALRDREQNRAPSA